MQKVKNLIVPSIKQCMNSRCHVRYPYVKYMSNISHKKLYIKFVRKNRNFSLIEKNKSNKKRLSLQFQPRDKADLMISRVSKGYHIQIFVDKHFQLVKYTKVKFHKQNFFPKEYKWNRHIYTN